MTQHKVLWTVSLSNGETLYEEKGNFKTIEGALSPWQRLLDYVTENDLNITSIGLYNKEGQRWNIPSAATAPKFHAFAEAKRPVGYAFFRKIGMDQKPGEENIWEVPYSCIAAQYQDGSVQELWVDNEKQNTWTLLK